MRAGVLVLTVAAALAGFSRESRSVAYFEAHGEEAARVVARCVDGSHRGQECANAQAALAAAKRKARMESYRRSF